MSPSNSLHQYSMQEQQESDGTGPLPDEGGSGRSTFQLSAKTNDKIKSLTRWRISPSLIEFPQDPCEVHGGNATVSRAFLRSADHDKSNSYQQSNRESSGRKVVAVKKLKIAEDTDLERVVVLTLREMGFLVELSHDNIVELEGFVEDISNDIIWLIFPWEENGNLRDFLAKQDWEIPERISLIDDVARGVEYLHNQKPSICHGDLKSLNILINSEYRAVITDFGSARRLSIGDTEKRAENKLRPAFSLQATFCTSTNTITLTGNGYTLRWAAPEQLMEDQTSSWSDIWALGWVFYEVMTNAIPFQDIQKDVVIIESVIHGHLPSISDHARMSLIQRLCTLMIMCWSIDPSKRPTAGECHKSISWMPRIVPNPTRPQDDPFCRDRSPDLLMELGYMHKRQDDYLNAANFFTEALGIYTDNANSGGKAAALWGLAEIHRLQDRNDEAIKLYSEALQIYTDIDDNFGRARTLWSLGQVHQIRDEHKEAIKCYSESLKISTASEYSQGIADAIWGLAEIHRLQYEDNEAIARYSEALPIYIDIGDKNGESDTLWGLGEVYLLRNEYSEATKCYAEALQIAADMGDRSGRSRILQSIADVHFLRNEYAEAMTRYSDVLQAAADMGDKQGRAEALRGLAKIHLLRVEYTRAITHFSEALQISHDIGDRQGKADAVSGLAHVDRLQNKFGTAIAHYSDALQIYSDIRNKKGRADCLWGLGEVHRLRNEYKKAIARYSEAQRIYSGIGNRKGKADTLQGYARVHSFRSEHGKAIALYSDALQIYTDISNRQGMVDALRGLAQVYRNQGIDSDAEYLEQQAAEINQQIGNTEAAGDALNEVADALQVLEVQETV